MWEPEGEGLEIDTHIHSTFSPDSRSSPELIVRHAISVGLGAIAVTDHDTWEGARTAAKYARNDILIIPGAELKTEKGDLLALFVTEEIKADTFARKVDEIHAKGGIAIVPHAGVSPRITPAELSIADGYEAFNAILSPSANRRSAEKASGLGKPGLGSSDAHLIREIGNGRTEVADCDSVAELREIVLKNPRVSRTVRSNPIVHRTNEAILFGVKGIWKR